MHSSHDADICLATACCPSKRREDDRPCSAAMPMAVGGWCYDRANVEIVTSTPKATDRANFAWPLIRPLPLTDRTRGENKRRDGRTSEDYKAVSLR